MTLRFREQNQTSMTRLKKVIIATLLLVFVVALIFYTVTELYLTTDYQPQQYGEVEQTAVWINFGYHPDTNDLHVSTSQFAVYENYVTERLMFNVLRIPGRVLHSQRTYYLCFDNIDKPLPLTENLIRDWFTDYGYRHSVSILDYSPEQTDFIDYMAQQYEGSGIDSLRETKSVSLVKKRDCSDISEDDILFEYQARFTERMK
jgi:hypothetical protein